MPGQKLIQTLPEATQQGSTIFRLLSFVTLILGTLAPVSSSASVAWTYGATTDVPVTAAAYSATGAATLSLNFAPSTGTALMVVKNTGLDFINGTFSNLAQGQAVALSFGGATYHFVANYYGGSGNDLVLQWANVRPMAWGQNTFGQLGNNSTTQSNVALAVSQSGVLSGKTVLAVAAGYSHSLALCSDGTLAAWGDNSSGQLGTGSAGSSNVPVTVMQSSGVLFGKTVVAIAAGQAHSLALCSDGTVAAWGDNGSGQLGNNSTTLSDVPVAVLQSSGVLSGKTVIAVAAGSYHNLALCSDGTLVSWGYNNRGQLGNSSTEQSTVPVAVLQSSGVLFGKTVIAITAGESHSLALCADGTVAAWGYNANGQLGNSSTTQSTVPVAVNTSGVLAGKTVVSVAAGGVSSLVFCSDGKLVAWGNNVYGQLGNNSTTQSTVPVAVEHTFSILFVKTVVAPLAGSYHGLALCVDGTLATWGRNSEGQLGNNSTAQSKVPVSTTPLAVGERFTIVSAGSCASHNLALVAAPIPTDVTVSGNGVTIANGDVSPSTTDFTNFGSVAAASGTVVRNFTIEYSAGTVLTLGSVTVSGGYASDFSVTAQPAASLDSGSSTTFQVTFNPSGNGTHLVKLSFTHNGREASPFNFYIQGTGLNTAPTASELSASSIVENNMPNATVGTLSAADVDPEDVPTFSLVSGDGSTDNVGFAITGTTLRLIPRADFERQSSYAIRIRVDDGQGGTFERPFTITVTDVPDAPTVTAPTAAGLTDAAATLGGNVIFDGGAAITERGIVYAATATNAAPSVGGSGVIKVTAGGTTGVFTASITGLSPTKAYSFRAYATNAQGTGYTNVVTFGTATFTYTAATDVPVTAANFTAGGAVALSLGFAPATGTNLMVVKNTGQNFITSAFSNLAQGQTVTLSFGVETYIFVANYYGGSGNDLVLQWATVRPMAWGRNTDGELGDNTTMQRTAPVAVLQSGVLSGKTVIAVTAGQNHSLALCSDGTLAAWGDNGRGQLGNNSTTDSSVPVAVLQSSGVLLGKTVIAVSAGRFHSLALCSDGTLAAWGGNGSGQLGNSSTTQSTVPVPVLQSSGLLAGRTVIAVAGGFSHSVALCSDGTLAAWGSTTTTFSTVPVAVVQSGVLSGKTVIAVSAGRDGNLALCSDGTVAGWGRNDYGQLGNSSTTDSSVPVAVNRSGVLSGKTVIAVATGTVHSLALCSDGTLAAWGSNSTGELGNNSTTSSSMPVAVLRSSGVLLGKTAVAVTAGSSSSAALCSDGTMAAWGWNSYGNLGNSSTTSSNVPVAVSTTPLAADERFTKASIGMDGYHTLAIVAALPPSPEVAVSGNSWDIADGDTSPIAADFTDFGYTATAGALVSRTFIISNSGTAALALSSVVVSGADAANFSVTSQPAASVAVGGSTTFEVTFTPTTNGLRSATVSFSGNDRDETLFNFSIQCTTVPPVNISATYTSAATIPLTASSVALPGGTATLALGYAPVTGTNLTVVKNTGLAFINGTFSNLAQGQKVALGFGGVTYEFVVNYYGGSGNDLVLQWANVRPMAWGFNSYGGLGNNSITASSLPVAVLQSGVLAGKMVIAVTGGYMHSLALCSDGALAVWGGNMFGQLGNNNQLGSKVPVAVLQSSGVLFGKTVIAITSGRYHCLALCADGTLAAWGSNDDGQLGDGSLANESRVPVAVLQSSGVLAGKKVIAIAAGEDHSLALCSDGTLAAWGHNLQGQLGNNTTTSSPVPVAVRQSSGVLSGKTVVSVSAGSSFSLALCSDGTLACWGGNQAGELGNNSSTSTNSSVPVAVLQSSGILSGKTVIAVATGRYHSLALCSDGTLAGWGNNFDGELGNNRVTYTSSFPVPVLQSGVLFGKTIIAITAGDSHNLALCSDGTLAAWGWNVYGQLGDGATFQRNVPVVVNTTNLAAGERFTIAGSGSSAHHTLALVAARLPIAVSGNSVAIADGDGTPSTTDFTDFGSVATAGGSVVRTFTINNPGTIALTLGSITVGGTNAADFSVTSQPVVSVAATGSTTFQITFNPSANGLRSATLSFIYNDNLENLFNFSIQGTGINSAPTAIALSATSIAENNTANATFGTLSVTDVDPGDMPTFSLVSGTGSTDNASFSIAGTALKLTPSADFETKSSYAIRIGVNDGQGGTFESPFIITITDELDAPTVTTPTVAGITATAADLGGNVTFDGGTAITERGVVYAVTATSADPSLGGPGVTQVTVDGTTGIFTAPATGLSPTTAYSFRAYATNAQGTSYTNVLTFSTTTFTYTAATQVPVTAASYTATGSPITLALGFAPETGTTLMVVNNTGLDFITGAFSNLAQGQEVALSFNGVRYRFVANYYGGSGNDLVLKWASVRPMAWGRNDYGQLGNSGTTQSTVPVAVLQSGVLAGKTVIAVAAGKFHSLALCSDGTLAAWGLNGFGQLGNNSYTNSSVPVAVLQSTGVLSGKTVIAVSAGSYHSLALCSDGTLAAWGFNGYGQLGNSGTAPRTVPVAVLQSTGVLSDKTVIAVAAGEYHSLALCSDGTLAAWGDNTYGQLGNNSTAGKTVPVAVLQSSGVLAGKTVIAVAAGGYHSLALCSDGTLAAWGYNGYAQLGNSSTTNSTVPVEVRQSSGVLAGKTVIAVAAGGLHSLALCTDGTLAAWGYNHWGQLGNNSTTNSTVPVAVVQSSGVLSGKTVIAVAAGTSHSLALCADGTLAAWGYNGYGQLGDNSTVTSAAVPVAVSTLPLATGERFTTTSSGSTSYHTLALVAAPPRPEITVSGNSVDIASGDTTPSSTDFTDFGNVALANTQVTHTFTISSGGDVALNLTGSPRVQIGGPAAADFKVTALPASPLAPTATTNFAITFDPSLPGLCSATVTIANDNPLKGNFTFTIQGFGQLITPLAQTITFTAPATVYLAQSPLQLTATASSGLPVSFNLVSGPPGTTLTDGVLTYASAGTVKVQATQGGGGNYASAKAVTLSLAIKADPTALTLIQLNQKYDGTPKPIGTEGGAGDVAITYTVNGSSTSTPPTNAGTYAVKAMAGTATKTGKLVISKAPLYVRPEDKRKFAGQLNPALTATYSGFIAPDNQAVITQLPVLSTTAKTTSPGGVYPIKASGSSALNYTLIYQHGTLVVESFAGNYEALLLDAADLPIGKLNLTVTTSGTSFSGKLLTATETAALPLSGPLTSNPANETAAGAFTVSKNTIPYSISFTLAMDGTVTASVTRDSILLGASDNGRKLLHPPKGQTAPYAGAHTAVFEPATPTETDPPTGAGWATASISTAGVVTLAGKLGDGTAFTTALSPDTDNDPGYRLFIQPYKPLRDQSYFGGAFTLKPHPSLPYRRYVAETTALTWNKKGLPGDASYRAGFGPVSTVLTLDPWLKPAGADTLQVRLGLPGDSFTITHSPTGSATHGELPASVSLTPANAVSVPVTIPANETKWQAKLNITTGAFTGSFVLQDTDPAQNRTAPFSGVLRQPNDALDTAIGDGHFLLPVRTGAPSPEKLSGEVLFTRP